MKERREAPENEKKEMQQPKPDFYVPVGPLLHSALQLAQAVCTKLQDLCKNRGKQQISGGVFERGGGQRGRCIVHLDWSWVNSLCLCSQI